MAEDANKSELAACKRADVRSASGLPREPATESSSWPDQAWGAAAEFFEWLSQPRVRLAVTGVILLAIGGLFMTNSVWTLPLVGAGALMGGIAWIGRRLDGRCSAAGQEDQPHCAGASGG